VTAAAVRRRSRRWAATRIVAAAIVATFGTPFVTGSGAAAQDEQRAQLASRFQKQLAKIAEEVPAVLGIQVVDLTSGERFGINETMVFPQGSAIKVPVLVELFRQASADGLRLTDRITIARESMVGGTGHLRHFRDGASALALHDLAVLMIIVSDNVATNLLIERVGMDNVTRTMGALGLPQTRLRRLMIRPEESARGNENVSTPAEAARLMERIHRCDLPMSATHCAELQAVLEIPHDGPIQESVPAGIRVGQKTGTITGVSTNWGYVDLPGRPYIVAVMGNYGESAEIAASIRRVADAACAYFTRLAGATPYGTRVPVRR
jgi:beta-lactamase class A